jgi:hypothetical protein
VVVIQPVALPRATRLACRWVGFRRPALVAARGERLWDTVLAAPFARKHCLMGQAVDAGAGSHVYEADGPLTMQIAFGYDTPSPKRSSALYCQALWLKAQSPN